MGNCSASEVGDYMNSASEHLPAAQSAARELSLKRPKSKQLSAKDIDVLKKATNLSEKAIRDLHAAFMKDYPSGELDKKGFKKFFEEMEGSNPQIDALCTNVFALFDKDKSGTVDFKEFMLGVAASKSTDLLGRLEFMFDLCDVSGDGQMDLTELTDFLSAALAANGTQASKLNVKTVATNIFKAFGLSTDQKLTKQQFIDGCKRNPDLQKVFGGGQ